MSVIVSRNARAARRCGWGRGHGAPVKSCRRAPGWKCTGRRYRIHIENTLGGTLTASWIDVRQSPRSLAVLPAPREIADLPEALEPFLPRGPLRFMAHACAFPIDEIPFSMHGTRRWADGRPIAQFSGRPEPLQGPPSSRLEARSRPRPGQRFTARAGPGTPSPHGTLDTMLQTDFIQLGSPRDRLYI